MDINSTRKLNNGELIPILGILTMTKLFHEKIFKVLAPGSLTLEWLEPLWNVLSDKVFVM